MKTSQKWVCFTIVTVLIWVVSSSGQEARLPAPVPPKEHSSAYTVTSTGNGAILVNVRTGQSWWLYLPVDQDRPVWLPISRFNDYQQAAEWLATQAVAGKARPAVEVQLAFAIAELKRLQSEYGTRHPQVIRVRDSIRALQKVAASSK
jgi:hypothetical protein